MEYKETLIKLIVEDKEMMDILKAVRSLQLPDWWVCAGFVRSKIWDTLHGFQTRTTIPDIDVIYYDASQIDERQEKMLEAQLKKIMPNIPWSVKNQARMHMINDLPPYLSSEDAISKFPETATAIGVRIDNREQLLIAAPWGMEDAFNLELKPTPLFLSQKRLHSLFEERVLRKDWKSVWYKLKVHSR